MHQYVDQLRSSVAFRYVVLRFERSMPQNPEETELLSREGAYNEAMLRTYTAEGEYDSFPTVEFDRLVVEHAEPRTETDTHRDRERDRESEAQAKQHADWERLFGEPGTAAEENGFRLTTEEYRYVLFDWTLYPTERQKETKSDPTTEPQAEPEDDPAPATAVKSLGGSEARLMRPSDVWLDRRVGTAPSLALSGQIPLSSVEEIGAALLFVQWKPGRLGLRDNFRYDNSSTGVRSALGIARPLDHRFVIHQSPSLPARQVHSRSGLTSYSSGCSLMATVEEVDRHVRSAWAMEVNTRACSVSHECNCQEFAK